MTAPIKVEQVDREAATEWFGLFAPVFRRYNMLEKLITALKKANVIVQRGSIVEIVFMDDAEALATAELLHDIQSTA